MKDRFEIVIPSFHYIKGSKFQSKLINSYGTWTMSVISPGNHELCGTILFDPEDGILIDYKEVKILVERKHNGNFGGQRTAEHLAGPCFVFGPFASTNLTGTNFEIIARVDMPAPKHAAPAEEPTPPEDIGAMAYYKDLLATGKNANVTIKTEDGKEMKAHELMLARSPVLSMLLSEIETKPDCEKIITIADVKMDVLTEMCNFLYIDKVPKIETHALDLLIAGNKYCIGDLVERCAQYLMSHVTVENFQSILINAEKLGQEKLLETTIDFMIKNRKTVFSSEDWKDLKKNNMPLAMTVMEKFMVTSG